MAAGIVGARDAPVAACSSQAPELADVAVAAQVIVRAEIAAVHGRRSVRRYDLRVLDVLKGRAPAVIRGFPAGGDVRGGVCDEGFGGSPGDPVFLFLGAPDTHGTLYHPRLQGRSWSEMNDGLVARSLTGTGITAEIRETIPTRRSLVPDALYLAEGVDGARIELPGSPSEVESYVRVLHHDDGQLSFRMWRLGGRRTDRFVIRAGDLATPGPILFSVHAQNSEDQAWAVGRARDAFAPSTATGSVQEAMALLDAGQAVVEVWPVKATSATGPRVHGLIRRAELPVVRFTPGRRGTVVLTLGDVARDAGLTALAWLPVVGVPIAAAATAG